MLFEALDGENLLRVDSVSLLGADMDAFRKHLEEQTNSKVGAKRGREEVEEQTTLKHSRYEKV